MSTGSDTLYAIIVSTVASTLVSWIWFSAYHFMQRGTARLIANHMKRSFLWMVIFMIGLPILLSPVVIAVLLFEYRSAPIVHQPIFSLVLILLSSFSILLGWALSYYPQRPRLKKIGAWGWPETDGEGEK